MHAGTLYRRQSVDVLASDASTTLVQYTVSTAGAQLISHLMPKIVSFDYICDADGMDTASNTADLGEMMQNKGHYTIQGHSRLPHSVRMKSQYATSC